MQRLVLVLAVANSTRVGVFHGLVTLTASSGSLAWAIHYDLHLTEPAPPPPRPPPPPVSMPPPPPPGLGASLVLPPIMVPQAAPLFAFNVKDFGAVGDGNHDDTLAIQTAMCAAGSHTLAARQGSFAESSAELFFPFGIYVISRALIPECNQGHMPGGGFTRREPNESVVYTLRSLIVYVQGRAPLLICGGRVQRSSSRLMQALIFYGRPESGGGVCMAFIS